MGWKKKTELIQQITTLMKPGLEDVQQSLRDQVAPLLELIQREIPFDADHPETMLQEIDAVFAIFDDIGATEACLSGLVAYGETKQLPSGADIDTWETMITSPQEEAAKIHAAFNGSAQMLTALGVPDIVQELEQEGMQKAIAEAMKNPQIDQAFDVMMGLGIEDPDHPIVEFIVMLMNLFKK